jgi:DNA-binding NarL/FixJ family response regulator
VTGRGAAPDPVIERGAAPDPVTGPVAPVKVVIADDVALLRAGVARMLAGAGFAIAGETGDAVRLRDLVARSEPDVAIIDVRMPPTHTTEGLEAARDLRERHPRLGLLILSHHIETQHAVELVRSGTGGIGYLLKERVTDPAAFVAAVRDVAAGGTAIDPEVVSVLLGRHRRTDPLAALTEREREVLARMAEGRSNQAIARHLVVSLKTVESHVGHVFRKLGLDDESDRHRRVAAVLAYLRTARP